MLPRDKTLIHPLLLWCLLGLLVCAACGEEESDPPPAPPPEFDLEVTPLGEGPGHWSAAQRGVSLDLEDAELFSVFPAEDLPTKFRTLVLNRPLVDWRIDDCLTVGEAAPYQPAQTSRQILDGLQARGVNIGDFERLAVNVDLLNPQRTKLLHLCLDPAGGAPSFFLPEHREQLLA